MGYLALYRKYRPTDFDSVCGQNEIVTVIKNAINNNKISHAYLFSGPRGTGKTTIAKIIAKMVNCEGLVDGNPCEKCYNCQNFVNSNDIVEIDAASNNGVDEIRELRDKINLVPSNAKYKVYIIDEVHMLTQQAFNALLKTLEEPPKHVIFILATTEPHKIPLTIASRCQKFRFTKINSTSIVDRLNYIAKTENINISNDALNEIARLSDGGMRDAINFLDQLISYNNGDISIDDIYKVNGSVSYDELSVLLKAIHENDKIGIITFFDKFDSSGKDINKFLSELIIFIKDVIIYKTSNLLSDIDVKNDNINLIDSIYSEEILYNLIEKINGIQNVIKVSTHGSILFMTSLLKFSDNNFSKNEKNEVINTESKKEEVAVSESKKTNDKVQIEKEEEQIISREIILDKTDVVKDENKKKNIDIKINNALFYASKQVLKEIKDKWSNIDDYLCDDNYSLVAGLLKDSNVVVGSDKYVIIANKLTSIVDRINDNCDKIEELFNKLFNYNLMIVAITDDDWNVEKEKYIKNIKNGIKYEEKRLILEKEEKVTTPVDELIDLIGDNIIEFK